MLPSRSVSQAALRPFRLTAWSLAWGGGCTWCCSIQGCGRDSSRLSPWLRGAVVPVEVVLQLGQLLKDRLSVPVGLQRPPVGRHAEHMLADQADQTDNELHHVVEEEQEREGERVDPL
jgi:hypothetical protein